MRIFKNKTTQYCKVCEKVIGTRGRTNKSGLCGFHLQMKTVKNKRIAKNNEEKKK